MPSRVCARSTRCECSHRGHTGHLLGAAPCHCHLSSCCHPSSLGCCMATRSPTSPRASSGDFLPCSCCKALVGHCRDTFSAVGHGMVNGHRVGITSFPVPGSSMPTRSTACGQMPSRTCKTSRCSHCMTIRSRAWPRAPSAHCVPSRPCECPCGCRRESWGIPVRW